MGQQESRLKKNPKPIPTYQTQALAQWENMEYIVLDPGLHGGRIFEKKNKIQNFWFLQNLKKCVQVNKDVRCMSVKFQDEIH